MKQGAGKPLSPLGKAIYLISMTLGCAFMVIGIGWLMELGCAIVLSTRLLSGRFAGSSRFETWVGRCIVLFALAGGAWIFMVDYRSGHVWSRYPNWGWICFISFVWLILMVSELKQKKNP